jgi:hypothetical protein
MTDPNANLVLNIRGTSGSEHCGYVNTTLGSGVISCLCYGYEAYGPVSIFRNDCNWDSLYPGVAVVLDNLGGTFPPTPASPTNVPTPAPSAATVPPPTAPTSPTARPTSAPTLCVTATDVNVVGFGSLENPIWVSFIDPYAAPITHHVCGSEPKPKTTDNVESMVEVIDLFARLLSSYTANDLGSSNKIKNKMMHALNGNTELPTEVTPWEPGFGRRTSGKSSENAGRLVDVEAHRKRTEALMASMGVADVGETGNKMTNGHIVAQLIGEQRRLEKCRCFNPYAWMKLIDQKSGDIMTDDEIAELGGIDSIFNDSEKEERISKKQEERASSGNKAPSTRPNNGNTNNGSVNGQVEQKKRIGNVNKSDDFDALKLTRTLAEYESLENKRAKRLKRVEPIIRDMKRCMGWILGNQISIVTACKLITLVDPEWLADERESIEYHGYSELINTFVACRFNNTELAYFMISLEHDDVAHEIAGNEELENDFRSIQFSLANDGYGAVEAETRNATMHALNGNIAQHFMSKKQMNKLAHTLNGNTSVLPVSQVDTVVSGEMKVPKEMVTQEVASSSSTSSVPLIDWVGKERGFSYSPGFVTNVGDSVNGDIFVKQDSSDGIERFVDSSIPAQEALMTYRDGTLGTATTRLKILSTLGIHGVRSRGKYLQTKMYEEVAAARSRLRDNTTSALGYYMTDLLTFGDVPAIQCDDMTYGFMKVIQLMLASAPSSNPNNGLPLRGPLESCDSTFFVNTGAAAITTISAGSNANLGEGVFWPTVPGFNPRIRLHVSLDTLAADEIQNAIVVPQWCATLAPEIFNAYVRLLVLMFLPAPFCFINWTIQTTAGEQLFTPFVSQIAFNGLNLSVVNLILPIRTQCSNKPGTTLEAGRLPIQIPAFNGALMEVNGSDLQALDYNVNVWLLEDLPRHVDPTIITNFLNDMSKMLGCRTMVEDARDRMRCLTWRGQPLKMQQMGDHTNANGPAVSSNPAGRSNTGNECDLVGCKILAVLADFPIAPARTDYVFSAATPFMFSQIAIGAYANSVVDTGKRLVWCVEEFMLSRALCRRFLMAAQIHWDMLGLSIDGMERGLRGTNNVQLRDYMYDFFSGAVVNSLGVPISAGQKIINDICIQYLGCSLPVDQYSNNILGYRRQPSGFQEAYGNGSGIDTTRLKFGLYTDCIMSHWLKNPILDYCQPPAASDGNVRLTMGPGDQIPLQGQPTATAATITPWNLNQPVYISSETWARDDSWAHRANRRAMLWLKRSIRYGDGVAAGQGLNTVLCSPLGEAIPGYSTLNMNYTMTTGRAASIALGRADMAFEMNNKLDIWPIIDATVTWKWIIIAIDAGFAAQSQLFYALLSSQQTVRVSRVININVTTTPINLLPTGTLQMNPMRKNLEAAKVVEMPGTGSTVKPGSANEEIILVNVGSQ